MADLVFAYILDLIVYCGFIFCFKNKVFLFSIWLFLALFIESFFSYEDKDNFLVELDFLGKLDDLTIG
jgi:hypothetical protein